MSNASILFERVQTNVMNEANSNGIKRVEKKSNNEIDNSSEQSYSMVPRSKTISVWQKQKKWTEFSSFNKDADDHHDKHEKKYGSMVSISRFRIINTVAVY